MRRSVGLSVGAYLPKTIVTNDELSKRVDTTDEWIQQRTGITQRHVAAEGETTSDLAVKAGEATDPDTARALHMRAAEELERAVTIQPALTETYRTIGMEYFSLGVLDKSIDNFKKAMNTSTALPGFEPPFMNAAHPSSSLHRFPGKFPDMHRMQHRIDGTET